MENSSNPTAKIVRENVSNSNINNNVLKQETVSKEISTITEVNDNVSQAENISSEKNEIVKTCGDSIVCEKKELISKEIEQAFTEQSLQKTQLSSKSVNTYEGILDSRVAPKMNCPEKIVFSIDLSTDMIDPPFKIGKNSFCPLVVVKRVIEMFVHSKTRIDSRHEYAFMSFHETAKWVKDFTNDPHEVIQTLDEMNDIKFCAECPLSSILSLLAAVAVDLPSFSETEVVPPPFVLRVILIYGRTNCMPKIKENIEIFKKLRTSPYFFFDILFIHESPLLKDKCQEIFNSFCKLDSSYLSYIFEVERDIAKLHNCMAKLLAHPLLRPLQNNSCYKLKDS